MRLPSRLLGTAGRHSAAARSYVLAGREKSTLSYRVFEDTSGSKKATKTALVMHGILGNKLNWRTFALKLTKKNPDWRFIVVDLRGHGDSPSFTKPHNLEACAEDVIKLTDSLKVQPTAVLGHSFGGKVALMYLQQCMHQDRSPPSQVWALDSLPGTGATDYASRDLTSSIETILPVVKKIPLPIRSKVQLVEDLRGYGIALGVAQWLTTNLRLTSKSPEHYEWRMDVDVIEELFRSFLRTDLWPIVEYPPATRGKDVELHFVHASKNKMWTAEILDRLEALQESQVYHHLLEKSGHWVHIDNPIGLMEIVQNHMLSSE
uniref:AB hydrolase-1 domain-containing protein n=1 Tax=Peronospora matthiolae TaxID=2874970 RepID=A0AAV1TMQ0_9STRA